LRNKLYNVQQLVIRESITLANLGITYVITMYINHRTTVCWRKNVYRLFSSKLVYIQ